MNTTLNLIGIVIAALILWRAEPALNRMSAETHWMVRYALLLMSAGAMGLLLYIFAGETPSPVTLILAAGIALMLICERRMRYLLPPHHRRNRHAQG